METLRRSFVLPRRDSSGGLGSRVGVVMVMVSDTNSSSNDSDDSSRGGLGFTSLRPLRPRPETPHG